MKLQDYAQQHGIKYRAAWNRYKAGKIPGAWQDEAGRIHIPDPPKPEPDVSNKAAVYARVSDSTRRKDLHNQAERVVEWCLQNGYEVVHITKEIGSGVSDKRKKLHALLEKDDYGILVVEHKDRLTRFGFEWFQTLLKGQGKELQVLRPPLTDEEDLISDLTSIVYSFTARLYGQRRAKQAQEAVKGVLER